MLVRSITSVARPSYSKQCLTTLRKPQKSIKSKCFSGRLTSFPSSTTALNVAVRSYYASVMSFSSANVASNASSAEKAAVENSSSDKTLHVPHFNLDYSSKVSNDILEATEAAKAAVLARNGANSIESLLQVIMRFLKKHDPQTVVSGYRQALVNLGKLQKSEAGYDARALLDALVFCGRRNRHPTFAALAAQARLQYTKSLADVCLYIHLLMLERRDEFDSYRVQEACYNAVERFGTQDTHLLQLYARSMMEVENYKMVLELCDSVENQKALDMRKNGPQLTPFRIHALKKLGEEKAAAECLREAKMSLIIVSDLDHLEWVRLEALTNEMKAKEMLEEMIASDSLKISSAELILDYLARLPSDSPLRTCLVPLAQKFDKHASIVAEMAKLLFESDPSKALEYYEKLEKMTVMHDHERSNLNKCKEKAGATHKA